ncbi:MAG: PAS domain-containing protein [Candidatus Brocadiia bacterium]
MRNAEPTGPKPPHSFLLLGRDEGDAVRLRRTVFESTDLVLPLMATVDTPTGDLPPARVLKGVLVSGHATPEEIMGALSRLKEWSAHLPLIVLGGSPEADEAQRYCAAGARQVISDRELARLPEAVRAAARAGSTAIDAETSRLAGAFAGTGDRPPGELAAQLASMSQVLRDVSDDVWVKDADLACIMCTTSYAREIGLWPEDLVGKTDEEIWGPEVGRRFREEDAELMANGKSSVRPEGTCDLHKIPILGQDGSAAGLVLWKAKSRDSRERAEKLLSYWATAVICSGDGMIGLDAEGRITNWNLASETIYGRPFEQVQGKHLTELVATDARETLRHRLDEVLAGEGIRHHEAVHLTAEGEPRHVALTLSPSVDPVGRIWGACAAARDVTRRVRAEQELRQTVGRLERTHRQLEELTGFLAQDLRREMLKLGELADVRAEDPSRALEEVAEAADAALRLVEDLATLTESGRADAGEAEVDCEEALEAALSELQTDAGRRADVTHSELPNLPARAEDMTDLLGGLIESAAQLSEADKPSVHVQYEGLDEQHLFRVDTDETSLDPETARSLFSFRPRSERGEQPEGLRLRLALCRRIAEGYRGRAWAELGPGGRLSLRAALPQSRQPAPHRRKIEELARQIRRTPTSDWDFPALAERLGLSYAHMQRLFTRYIGQPVHTYRRHCLMRRAAWALRHEDRPVKAIARSFGYQAPPQFSRAFKRTMGMTPTEYRESAP